MRHQWAVIAGLGILLTSAGSWAQEMPENPGVLVLSERSARPAPTVVRGRSATPAAASVPTDAQGLQIIGGERLWVVDRASGEVRSCIDQSTSTVGLRVIRCTSGEFGRYGRTFGANFHP